MVRNEALEFSSTRGTGFSLRNRSEYRVRVGDYRIIYEVEESTVLILVLAMGHPGDVHR